MSARRTLASHSQSIPETTSEPIWSFGNDFRGVTSVGCFPAVERSIATATSSSRYIFRSVQFLAHVAKV